ncbi:hypothetical protein Tco_1169179, partial [Tanacetum coccineum]
MVVGAGCGRWGGVGMPWRWWAAATAAGGVGGDDEGTGGAWR